MPLTLTLTLAVSDEDLATINHVVAVDPEQQPGETPAQAWVRRVWATLGVDAPRAIADKVNRYRASYLAAKEAEGDNYLTAAQRAAQEQQHA